MEYLSEDALSNPVPIMHRSVINKPHGLSERYQLFVELAEILVLVWP